MPNTGWLDPIVEIHPLPTAGPLAVASAAAGDPFVALRGPRQVFHQQNIACCVSCALATCLESLDSRNPALAPLFHYVKGLMDLGTQVEDNLSRGLRVDEGRSTLTGHGISSSLLHPYPFVAPAAASAPSPDAVRDALTRTARFDAARRIGFFREIGLRADPVGEIKGYLREKLPILFGIHLTSGREALKAGRTKKLENPGTRDGAHAVACLGYDDREASFIVQDSFGKDFGQGGQWYLPYQTFAAQEPVVFQAIVVGINLRRRT